MTIAGCYVLNLNCDDPNHDRLWVKNGSFTGEGERDALKAARAAGWFVRPVMNDARCPRCLALAKDHGVQSGERVHEGPKA